MFLAKDYPIISKSERSSKNGSMQNYIWKEIFVLKIEYCSWPPDLFLFLDTSSSLYVDPWTSR